MNMSAVTTGNAASVVTTKPTKTPSTTYAKDVSQSRTVSPTHEPAFRVTPPKPAPTTSTNATTGSTTSMPAEILVPTYDQDGIGVIRSWRAQPDARSIESLVPPALRAATRAPKEHIETIR